jgi:hypothetical protein
LSQRSPEIGEIAEFLADNMVNTGNFGRFLVERVACRPDRSYLNGRMPSEGFEMSATLSTASLSRPLVLIALLAGVILAATLGLWACYGTTVFFEMVRAGWMACF